MMARALMVVVLWVGLLAAVSLAALPAFDTTRLYSQAAFAAAIKPYTDAVAQNANDAEAHYWLGVAYLHGARLFRFGLAPYAREFAARAVASLERAVRLRADPRTLMALLEAYVIVGDRQKSEAIFTRLGTLAQPIPLK